MRTFRKFYKIQQMLKIMIESGDLVYLDLKARKRIIKHLDEHAEHLSFSSKDQTGCSGQVNVNRVYHFKDSTVILNERRTLEMDNKYHYRSLSLLVASEDPIHQQMIMNDLVNIINRKDQTGIPDKILDTKNFNIP